MSVVYLGLGSNVGDRLDFLRRAHRALNELGSNVVASPVYETEPWGVDPQPRFLNAVCKIETNLSAAELLAACLRIETSLGRVRARIGEPRTIDLDVLVYDDQVIESAKLTLPHPRLHERAFVLAPFADLAPELMHPVLRTTIAQLFEQCDKGIEPPRSIVERL
jgi:2-amino-4-hydroxy-6-hydroxymethyldihydropteridine diphosphokinase